MHVVARKKKATTSSSGFTLIELSIVIIIIGILIAGTAGGVSLIKQSKIQGTIKEIATYDLALANFVGYYKALPGDMSNAFAYWGATAANCINADININSQGCNGNGDSFISWPTEGYKYWQHLSLAKMVNGNYSGTATSGIAIPGVNVPISVTNNTCYSVETNNLVYSGLDGHILELGGTDGTITCLVPIIPTEDTLVLDQKIDDGLPLSGKVRPRNDNRGGVTCTIATTHNAYNLSSTGNTCTLAYLFSTPK